MFHVEHLFLFYEGRVGEGRWLKIQPNKINIANYISINYKNVPRGTLHKQRSVFKLQTIE